MELTLAPRGSTIPLSATTEVYYHGHPELVTTSHNHYLGVRQLFSSQLQK
jgi:hypothetical protein